MPKPKPKTAEEINAEIAKLKALRPMVVPQSAFGDDNLAALGAAIEALDEDMGEDDAYEKRDSEEWTEGEEDAALMAIRWRDDEDEAYSDGLPLKH